MRRTGTAKNYLNKGVEIATDDSACNFSDNL
jgi:hypothetical protein